MKKILIIALAITASFSYNTLQLPYQTHGFNDLDIALQELIKGTYNFKFDIGQATKESCEKYSNWNRNYSECGYYGDFGFQICCLGMRGDWSQQPIYYSQFNTSDDMLAMISNPKYSFIFNKNTHIKKYMNTKHFAINFQYSSRNLTQTTDFIYNFLKIIEDKNLNLKLVTGTTSLIQYYDNKCLILQQCNKKEEYISKSDIILQQQYNGPRNRTIQFNVRSNRLPTFCANGFPEYMYRFNLPIQFWQPTYQDSIYEAYDQFWDSKCNKSDVDVNRFKITSNMNSENLAVLLQRANQTSKVQYVPPKYRFNDQSEGIIEYNNQLKLFFFCKKNTKTQNYELTMYNQISLMGTTAEVLIFNIPIIKLSTKGNYLLVESSSQLIVYEIQNTSTFKLVSTLDKRVTYICCDIVLMNEQPYFSISSLVNSYTIEVKLININDGKTLLKVNQPLLNVEASGFKYVSSIHYNGQIIQVYSYEYINKQNGISEVQFFYHTINISSSESQLIYPSSPLHYGSNTSLKIEEFQGKIYFISTSGNGSSWSGVLINNNNWNKCVLYKDDYFKMVRNIPYTITYMWGMLDDLVERIKGSTFINSCDKRIFTTKVFNGKNPQITIVRDDQDKPTAYLMAEFVHYHKLPVLATTYYIANSYESNYPDEENFHMNELVQFDLVEYEIFDLF